MYSLRMRTSVLGILINGSLIVHGLVAAVASLRLQLPEPCIPIYKA